MDIKNTDKNHEPLLFTEEELLKGQPGTLWYHDPNKDKLVTVLGHTFKNDDERREYFREELRKKLPELKKMEGFPIGEDDDIINLSDPPYYTACPNPWLNDFIDEWEQEKKQLAAEGKREENAVVTEPYASDVSEGKNNPIYMAHAYHTKVPHPAIMRYILHYTQPGDIIFDGFAGTGMTGVAAGKCSDKAEVNSLDVNGNIGQRHCILGDLSPIASFITYNFNNPVDENFLSLKAKEIIGDVKKELGYLYNTKHTNGDLGCISYVIWSDVLRCPNCGNELSYWRESVDEEMHIKPIVCPHCGAKIEKTKNTVCKETKVSANGDVVFVTKKEPVLIRYEYKGKKYTKIPDEDDLKLISDLDSKVPNVFFPKNKIIDGVKTAELIRSGYTDISMLYTRRNLFIFSALWEKMRNYPLLRFALTAILVKTGSLLHNIGLKDGKINLAGALPNALFVPSALAERNVFELLEGKLKDIAKMEPSKLHRCLNQIQSATDLRNIKSESIDYIFTDPPFGHNLMYSELNFIHEGWLGIQTNNKDEAIENSSQNKSVSDYTDLMSASFDEYYRILKPGKWMTVEFSNTSAAVWNSIQRALTKAGFIISVVRGLDKKQGSYNAQTTTTAVKQDLVISCYKSSTQLLNKLKSSPESSVWDYIDEHLNHLPVVSSLGNKLTTIIERSPKILYDRLISSYVERSLQIPLDASKFQKGLRERYIEKDGMFFTAAQAVKYEEQRKKASGFAPMGLIISDEANGIEWLKHELKEPKTYAEISPKWMADISGLKKGDILPELKDILEENFIEDENGRWHIPDTEKAIDMEKLHHKTLMREFNLYKEQAAKPRARIKEVRVEALREGFKECFKEKDFKTILTIGDKIPQNILTEDEQLLQYYDIASMRA